jgi:DNA repair/transcription protein MET18/MMS19
LGALFDTPAAVILSTWVLAALPRASSTILTQKDQMVHSIEDLVLFAEKSDKPAIELSCLRQIGLYINKHLSTSDLTIAEALLGMKYTAIQASSEPNPFKLRLIFFVTKSLVLRLAPNTQTYLSNLVSLLTYPTPTPRQSALLFHAILSSDDVLSKSNGAQLRLLAPQRVFQCLVPLISTQFRSATDPTIKENSLVALSGVLSTVPSELVMPELPTLLPLLLQSLDISDQSVKIATLETLAVVIANNAAALDESGHIPALVGRLLKTATLRPASPATKPAPSATSPSTQPDAGTNTSHPRTRLMSARCLSLLPTHLIPSLASATASSTRANPLLALKRSVLQGLMPVLDDPRRDVRKMAVDARAAWLRGVDDEGDDDDE